VYNKITFKCNLLLHRR